MEEEEYEVVWRISLPAKGLQDAARQALEIQRDPESIATVFEVSKHGVGQQVHIVDPVFGSFTQEKE